MMPPHPLLDPTAWALQTFGATRLGDARRPARAVQLGAALLARPAASLPQQLATSADLKAAYHLLHAEGVSHAALLAPCWEQTRQAARAAPVVLLTSDTTILDYSHHRTTTGLGPIGNGRGRGYLVHSVLAICPSPRTVLGLAHQIPFVPQQHPAHETLREKQARARQTDMWPEAVTAIGRPPAGGCWIHVGDREADFFRFFDACREQQADFVVRAAKNRRVAEPPGIQDDGAEPAIDYLFPRIRSWAPVARGTLAVPARAKEPAREAQVRLSFRMLQLQPPRQEKSAGPLVVWAIRVWEVDAPTTVKKPLEWVLLTSVETTTVEQAWERVGWYSCRWTNEDYHQCLKTGCQLEHRHLHDQPALERMLALCAPTAVQLLQLRDLARAMPDHRALDILPPELVQVVAALAQRPPRTVTVHEFWLTVAKRGGYLGRTRDGPPGWKTLWRGWQEVQQVREGVKLAAHLAPL